MSLFEDFVMQAGGESPLYPVENTRINITSTTTDLVNKGNEYLKQNISNINKQFATDNTERGKAVRNRTEYYNPATKEERKLELEEEFNSYSLPSKMDAEYAIFREGNKEVQAEKNTIRALIKRERDLNEQRKNDPSTIEYGLSQEYGINIDSSLSQGITTNFLTALALKEFGGDDPVSLTFNTLLRGESLNNIRNKIANAPLEQQKAYYKALTEALVSEGNILTPQYASNLEALESIIKDDYSPRDRVFDDVISIFDSVGAIASITAAKNTAKGLKEMKTLAKAEKLDNILTGLRGVDSNVKVIANDEGVRVVNLVTNSNPSIMKDGATKATSYLLAKEALNSTGEEKKAYEEAVKAATGQTPEEQILSATLPTVTDPQAPLEKEEILKAIKDYSPETYSVETRDKIAQKIKDELGETYASNVDIDIQGTFLSLKTTVGKDGKAFSTYKEAKSYVDTILDDFNSIGVRPEEIKIVGRDAKGNLVDAKGKYRLKEYYLQLEHNSDIEYRMKSELGEAADYASSVFNSSAFLRSLKSNILTPSAIYSSSFMRPLIAAVEYVRGFNVKVFKEGFDEINKNLRGMSKSDKDAIVNLLFKGNKDKKKFTPQELREQGFTQKQIDVIYGFYDAEDKSHTIKNLINSRILNRAGFRTTRVKDRTYFIRDRKEVGVNEEVIDLATGKLANKNKIKEGAVYYELANPVEINGVKYKYGVSSVELPKSPINPFFDDTIGKIPGYIDMRFKENQMYLELDGHTIGVARSSLEAMERAEAISESRNIDINRFTIRAARENSTSDAITDATAMQSRDDITLINQTAAQALENPFDTIQLGISKASNDVMMYPVISKAKQDFVTVYKDVLKNGEFPKIADDIVGSSKEANKARKMFEYIRTLEKNQPNSIDTVFKQTVNSFAEVAGDFSLKSGGLMANVYASGERALLKLARIAPVKFARQLTSIAYITTNPFRQLLLQTVQGFNALGVDPISMLNGKTMSTAYEGIMYLSGVKRIPPSKEMEKFLDIIHRMGMFSGQSSLSYVSEAVAIKSDGILKKALVDLPAKGVIYGENAQQYIQASALYNKYLRENGLKWFDNRENIDTFVEQLRLITGGQTPVESFPYEHNALSLVMQFVQAPHKMLTLLFNKEVPSSIRRNILLTNLVVFGSGYHGYKVVSHLVNGIDDPDIAQAVQYGAFGLLVNKLSGMVLKTENFAPISVSPIYESSKNILGALLGWTDSNDSVFDTLSIPAAGFAKYRITPLIKDFLAVGGVIDNPDGKTLGEALHNIPRLSSGYNAAYKSYLALTTGNYYDNKGQVVKEGLGGPQAMALLLGFQPETFKDVEYKLKGEIRKSRKEKTEMIIGMWDAAMTEASKQFPNGSIRGNEEEAQKVIYAVGIMMDAASGGDPQIIKSVRRFANKKLKEALSGNQNNVSWLAEYYNNNVNLMNEELEFQLQRLDSIDPMKAKEIREQLKDYRYGDE